MAKLKIEREDKLDLVINGKVFLKDTLYHVIAGDDIHHAYYLTKIYKDGRDWMLRLGEHDYDAEIRFNDLEASHPMSFRKCECSFTCEGYVLKGFTWG